MRAGVFEASDGKVGAIRALLTVDLFRCKRLFDRIVERLNGLRRRNVDHKDAGITPGGEHAESQQFQGERIDLHVGQGRLQVGDPVLAHVADEAERDMVVLRWRPARIKRYVARIAIRLELFTNVGRRIDRREKSGHGTGPLMIESVDVGARTRLQAACSTDRTKKRMSIQKIVSGGQTGVDRAALDAAMECGVAVGGWCPYGRRAEDGTIPERYPLEATPSAAYAQRTVWNVRDSDGTLILGDPSCSQGTELTERAAQQRGKPLLQVNPNDSSLQLARKWLCEHPVRVLNVAGPREGEAPGIYASAKAFVERLLQEEASSSDPESGEGRRR